MTVGQYAEQYLAAGFSVLPIRPDGSKAPAISAWREYMKRQPTLDEVRDWHSDETLGTAIIAGSVSGNLGILDIEFEDVWEEYFFLIREELGIVAAQLPLVKTPGKSADQRGRHLYFRSRCKISTRKLAKLPTEEARRRTGDKNRTTAIEIKGEGGYVLAPGCSAACHESGRLYERANEVPIELAPTLDEEQVRILIACARALDRDDKIRVETGNFPEELAKGEIPGSRPGDEFKRLANWNEILEPHGWKVSHRRGNTTYWRRPGKTRGVSATTGYCSNEQSGDLFYVFTTNADPFEDKCAYSKFAAMAFLDHGGNFHDAAKVLARNGYGDSKKPGQKGKKKAKAEAKDDSVEQAVKLAPMQEPFPVEIFPEVLQSFSLELAEAFSCPLDFPGIGILGIASAAIGASRAIRITQRWAECPRFYFAIVSDPGSGKTPAINAIAAPLIEEQDRLAKDFHLERERYEEKMREWEKDKATAKSNKTTPPEKPLPPIFRHLYTNDPTVESLVPMLSENPRGFLFLRDEITAWMLSLNQYKGGKGADRQFWLSQWSGESHKTDRKGTREQGSIIARNPCISVLGGIQPEMIGELCDERGREDGFVHRILFAFPPECKWSEDFDVAYNQEFENTWRDSVAYMLSLPMHDDNGFLRPRYVFFTDEGRQMAKVWYKEHAQERNAGKIDPGLIGPWSKMRSYFFRSCLVLHTLRIAVGEIPPTQENIDALTVIRAGAFMKYLKSHARLIYPRLRQRKEDRLAERALLYVRKKGGVCTARQLVQSHIVERTTEAVELLQDLADRGFGVFQNIKDPKAKTTTPTFTAHADSDEMDQEWG